MGRINWIRVILGGILAGVVSTVFGAVLGMVMHSEFEAAMKNFKPRVDAHPSTPADCTDRSISTTSFSQP
jgi:hypothetical protein